MPLNPKSKIENLKSKISIYWPLIKSMQTGLLLITGIAGYMSARCPILSWAVPLKTWLMCKESATGW